MKPSEEVDDPMSERSQYEARQLLDRFGYDLPVDVEAMAIALNVTIRAQPLEEAVSGMLVMKDGRAIIGVNQNHHPNRQRFSIAHELGHFLLHGKSSHVFVDAVYFRDAESSEGSKRQEIEANAFAAELLMPERVIREQFRSQLMDDVDDVAIRRLAGRFGVSQQALTIHLTTLGLIAG